MADITEQLERFAHLLTTGRITQEQHDNMRDRLLAESAGPERVGAYQVTGYVGEGGMATVYRGEHRSDPVRQRQGGEVAIKVMHPHVAARPAGRALFEREAELGLELDHRGIVKVHDLVQDGTSLALVMEYVDGKPLSDRIGTETGPMPWDRAWPLFEQLLDAVAYMHAMGVVHRDLKPENVLVSTQGRVQVLDLGIAEQVGSNHSRRGVGLGTPDYMAPEQHENTSRVEGRADVFALGMTLYEMLAGTLPWGDMEDPERIQGRKRSGEIPPPTAFYPDIPEEIVQVVMSSLAADPGARIPSAEAFGNGLRTATAQAQQRGTREQDEARVRAREAAAARAREEEAVRRRPQTAPISAASPARTGPPPQPSPSEPARSGPGRVVLALFLLLVSGVGGAAVVYFTGFGSPGSDAAEGSSEDASAAADDDDSAAEEPEATPAPAKYRVSSKPRKRNVRTGEWVEIDITVRNPPSGNCSAQVRWRDRLGISHPHAASAVSGSRRRFVARWPATPLHPFGTNRYKVTATCGGKTTSSSGRFKYE